MVFSWFCLSLPNINDIKKSVICYIAMRYPKMSQPEKDVVVVQPTEVPNTANEVVIVNTTHKRDAATKEKVLKLLKLANVITATGSDTGPATPTITSIPEPGTPRSTYDT